MRYLILLLCAALLPAAAVCAEEAYTTKYSCFDTDGRERWAASADIVRAPGEKRSFYILTSEGAGVLSGFKGKVSWAGRLEFESTEDMVRPVSMENRVFNDKLEPIFVEKQEFDHKAGKVRYTGIDLRWNRTRKAEYNFKGDIANRLILGLYIQKFLERGGKERSLVFLSGEPRLYAVKLKMMGKEQVVINGVKKEAFRLCLDPELGILDFLKVVIPKAYVWHLAAPKFEWLKYRGLENNLGSPVVEIISGDIR